MQSLERYPAMAELPYNTWILKAAKDEQGLWFLSIRSILVQEGPQFNFSIEGVQDRFEMDRAEIWLGALPQHRVIQTICQFYRDNGITFNNPPPLMPNLFIGPQHEFILYLIGLCHHNRLGFDLVMHLSMDVSFGRLPLVDMDPTIAVDEMPALDEDGINPPIIYHLGTHGWITAMAFSNICDELLDPRNFRLLQSEIYYLVRAVDRKLRTKFTSYIIVNSITSELNNQLPDSEDPGHCTYTVYVRFRPNEERASVVFWRAGSGAQIDHRYFGNCVVSTSARSSMTLTGN